jgi:starch synthase
MKIIFAAPEAAPFASTGGLGDVASALPKALGRLGHDVRLIMPLYGAIDAGRYRLGAVASGLAVPSLPGAPAVDILEGWLPSGLRVYFVRHDASFNRDGLYQAPSGEDYPDNAERFALFSRASLEACRAVAFRPEVVHAHDWQTALVPVYLHTLRRGDPFFEGVSSVFTVHNLGYQGIFQPDVVPRLGLGWELFTPAGIEFYGKVNLLKGGLLFADTLTTVSPRYSREIQTPSLGHGLDGLLRQRSKDLFGILNGIDPEEWSPATDSHIVARYSVSDRSGKALCKIDLQRRFRLPEKAETPILGVISRLAWQKGHDLLRDITADLMGLELQLVLLGSGEKALEASFVQAAAQYPSKLAVKIGFDTPLAHQIEAGADLFLMPSRYEPCGLNQMYSLAYGTIPVVRATGGLDDTIVQFDPRTGRGNGVKFEEATAAALLQSIMQGLALFSQKAHWDRLVVNAMTGQFTWDRAAREYAELYRRAVARRARP